MRWRCCIRNRRHASICNRELCECGAKGGAELVLGLERALNDPNCLFHAMYCAMSLSDTLQVRELQAHGVEAARWVA